jgi:transposase
LEPIDYLRTQIAQIDTQIAEVLEPYQSQHSLLQTMPGIRKEAAARCT